MIGPIIKDFLDINIKNDEHIVRLVQIAQRMVSVTKSNGSSELLTEEEKNQLLSLKDEMQMVINDQEVIQDEIIALGAK